MKLLAKFWKNFKAQPDIWFFYGFFLTFTLSIRKVLFYFPLHDSFNEYSGIYLYLSDIFLCITLVLGLKSILKSKSLFLSRSIVLTPLLLALWSFISIVWSENHWLAVFRSIKILEFFLLFIYITQKLFHPVKFSNVPRLPRRTKMFHVEHFQTFRGGTFIYNSFLIISISGLFQSIIGIVQIFIQHSLGLFWLKESLISPEIPGVAKIILDGERYIRAYGLFPHPNILGGFLVFSILITIYLLKTTSSGLRPPSPCKVEGFLTTLSLLRRGVGGEVGETFLKNSLGIQTIGLILTFSKSAILGLIIALIYLNYKKMFRLFHACPVGQKCSTLAPLNENVPRGTFSDFSGWNIFGLFGVEHPKRKLLLILIFLALIVVITKPDLYSFFQKSLEERTLGYKVVFNTSGMFHACPVVQKCSTWNISEQFQGGTFITNPIAGIGQGQFVMEMQKYIPQKLSDWQFQPVHNVFLLILSELGLVGLGLFVWFLWKLLVPRGTFYFKSILLAFIFIMLFDHYLWDIQQGQILLWLTFGLIAGDSNLKFDKK